MSSRATSLEPKSQFTINLDPGWECQSLPSEENKKKRKEIPNQKGGRKQKEENSRLKIGRKHKKYTKRSLDQTTSEQIQSYHQVSTKRKETTTWSGPLPLIANQNLVRRWLVHLTLNKNKKGKGPNTQSQISHQMNPFPRKSPIDPWSRM